MIQNSRPARKGPRRGKYGQVSIFTDSSHPLSFYLNPAIPNFMNICIGLIDTADFSIKQCLPSKLLSTLLTDLRYFTSKLNFPMWALFKLDFKIQSKQRHPMINKQNTQKSLYLRAPHSKTRYPHIIQLVIQAPACLHLHLITSM